MHYKAMQQRVTGHGRFTKEEEHKIWEGITKFGKKWGAVAAHVGGGRNRSQVMHHWENVMKMETDVPNRLGRWSADEDALLVQVSQHPLSPYKLHASSSECDIMKGMHGN